MPSEATFSLSFPRACGGDSVTDSPLSLVDAVFPAHAGV